LVTQRRSEIIKAHEESIVNQAIGDGHARYYKQEETPEAAKEE
jgi:hypothetical protein